MTRTPIPISAGTSRQSLENFKRAFVEFLTIPTLVIASFLLLALGTYFLDASGQPASKWGGLFSDPQATRDFLGVIAQSIITVTTTTFSLLLIAVQQGAAALTSLVLDQFLRRKVKSVLFRLLCRVGALLIDHAGSVNPSHQPALGVAMAGIMTAAALYMLIFLIYSTINQMRPVVILSRFTVTRCWRETTSSICFAAPGALPGFTENPPSWSPPTAASFVTRLDAATIGSGGGRRLRGVVIHPSIGDYVSFGDPVAELRAAPGKTWRRWRRSSG